MNQASKKIVFKIAQISIIAVLVGLLSGNMTQASTFKRATLSVGQMQNFTFLDSPERLPEISFLDIKGQKLTLADFYGKIVLVNLWATWCAPCRHEMPSLDRLQGLLSSEDFTVLALSQDRKGIEVVIEFLEDTGVSHLGVYIDPTARSARKLGIIGLPTTLLLDRDGLIIGRLVGTAEWDSDDALRLVKTIIHEPSTPN